MKLHHGPMWRVAPSSNVPDSNARETMQVLLLLSLSLSLYIYVVHVVPFYMYTHVYVYVYKLQYINSFRLV